MSAGRSLFIVFASMVLSASTALADEGVAMDEPTAFRGLQATDWVVVAGYGVFMVLLGLFYSRRQSTTEDYFLAGRRTGALIAGVSLFATLVSTVSFLSAPGELIKHGPVFLLGNYGVLLAVPLVGYVLIPAIMRVPVTSAYEILEARLGHAVRMLGSAIFIATRLVWMALLMHVFQQGTRRDDAVEAGYHHFGDLDTRRRRDRLYHARRPARGDDHRCDPDRDSTGRGSS